jgi:N-methylhydantoinase B
VRHNTCQRFADTLIRALTALWPQSAVASSSVTFFCINIGSTSPTTGRPSVLADCVGGGTGATSTSDGIDGVDTYMSNVGLMPAEVAETNYQVRILRTELLPGSQGDGMFRGGMGLRREYEILDHDQRATFYAEQTHGEFAPQGAAGGRPGSATTVTVLSPEGVPLDLPSKASTHLPVGSIVRVETAGGGGYGDPALRSAEARVADAADGTLG